jgi:broad specificity phosphatase PhoE
VFLLLLVCHQLALTLLINSLDYYKKKTKKRDPWESKASLLIIKINNNKKTIEKKNKIMWNNK